MAQVILAALALPGQDWLRQAIEFIFFTSKGSPYSGHAAGSRGGVQVAKFSIDVFYILW